MQIFVAHKFWSLPPGEPVAFIVASTLTSQQPVHQGAIPDVIFDTESLVSAKLFQKKSMGYKNWTQTKEVNF